MATVMVDGVGCWNDVESFRRRRRRLWDQCVDWSTYTGQNEDVILFSIRCFVPQIDPYHECVPSRRV